MIALIDGDIIAYQAAAAHFREIDWNDGSGPQPTSDLPAALDTACRVIGEWTAAAGADSAVICFSPRDGSNFRKVLDPTYKFGRPDKPAAYWDVVDGIEARFKYHRLDNMEGDDIMGIAATGERYGQAVIVSLDKDMQTIPALVFNPTKDARPRQIVAANADRFWMTQTLTGDPTDGYKGCPRIGPVKAARVLAAAGGVSLGAMWGAVVDTYETAGLTEADALLQARLARILRSSDYDRQQKEIKLWHPTKPETFAPSAALALSVPTAACVCSPGNASVKQRRSRRK